MVHAFANAIFCDYEWMYAYVQEEGKKRKKTMVCEYLKSLETRVPSRVKRMTENPQGLPLYLRRWKYTYTAHR